MDYTATFLNSNIVLWLPLTLVLASAGTQDGQQEIREYDSRALSHYLDGDMYYKVSYPEQNLNRAKTHLKLLIDLQQKQELLEDIVKGYS